MALHLDYKTLAEGSWHSVDLTASRVGNMVCKFSDSAAASLSWSMIASQHTFPIGLRNLVRLWDDAGTTPDGSDQDDGNPLFEGYVWECEPAESNRLNYVAYDPSQMAGREIPVMSTAWDASVSGNPPEPATGAVPRLILNSTIDNDADYAFERASGQTIGQILAMVLDDAIEPLRWYQAAPGASSAYVSSELSAFDFVPQEKVVATNEPIRAFIDRLTQQNYPDYAFLWYPGTHKWHWYPRRSGTAVTLALNDPAPSNGYVVSSMELHRSLDGRYPAVMFYGPEVCTVEVFSTLDSTLAAIDSPFTLETYTDSGGSGTVQVHQRYQIVDTSKRRGCRLLPEGTTVRDDDYHYVQTRSPMFEISFDGGASWQAVESCIYDFQNGSVFFGEGLYTYFYTDHPPAGSTQHYFPPNAFRLIWAPYADPISVRSPSSGYSGTSNSVAGQTSVLRIYDEMLSVGYNRIGTPVTTASRLAQYQKLADAILAAKKDIVYTGGCVLEGIQYEFCRLNRVINLAAVDADGATITTGWESIGAVLSEVEYNFSELTTTLTFSQEALNTMGDSIDLLKQRLRIKGALERIRIMSMSYQWRHEESTYSNKPGGYNVISGITYNDYDLWYNSDTGTKEAAL